MNKVPFIEGTFQVYTLNKLKIFLFIRNPIILGLRKYTTGYLHDFVVLIG